MATEIWEPKFECHVCKGSGRISENIDRPCLHCGGSKIEPDPEIFEKMWKGTKKLKQL